MDAAILLGAMTGVDPADPATQTSEGKAPSDYTSGLSLEGLQGARIGVARNLFGFHHRADEVVEKALLVMKDLGAELVEDANLETKGKFEDSEYETMLYEYKHGLNAYFESLGPDAPVKSLEEVIAFNKKNSGKMLKYFDQKHLEKALEKGPLTDKAYLKSPAR